MRHVFVTAILLIVAATSVPVAAGELERTLESRWRGAWVLTAVDTFSDCAGTHTNNRVNGTLVSSRGRIRFRPGELAQVGKVDLKRSRLDILVGVPEPILVSFRDGPFTLYNETRCLIELDVELPRSLVSNDDANGIDAAIAPVLKRFTNQDEALQANAAIQARIDKALEETARLTDRVTSDPDYLKGFAAGVEAMRAVDLGQCGELMSRDFTNVAPAPKQIAVASFAGEAAGRYTRGFQDGQRLVYGLECLRRLPQCMVPVPPAPGNPGARGY